MYPGEMRIGAEEEKAILDVLRSKRLFRYYGPYSGASRVDEFEKAFAAYTGTGHAVAVSSGSASLVCGLAALGVGPGDEVIVPAYTWIASAEAVIAVGAVPILAEIDQSLTLDVADVESKITGRTKAIMPVHMRGAPCQMHRIVGLAQPRGLKVLEDVAQAAGGSFLRATTRQHRGRWRVQFPIQQNHHMRRRRHRYHKKCGIIPANCHVSRCCGWTAQ